jgi:hypothetical protein
VRLCLAFVAYAGASTLAFQASADPNPLEVHADFIDLESRTQELYLRGNVQLDSEPFHLTASELRLSRSSRGVVVKGEGRIAFCPCLGQPLAIAFRGATVAPPGDLLLDQPTLELFRLPVLWAPFFWLRSPGKVGLLPPDIAYRGADGVFLGEGLHLPWRTGDTESGLDLHAGAYLKGGVAIAAMLKTPDSVTTLRWDHLQSDGFGVDARGALLDPSSVTKASVAWDADILSGQRGVVATTDVDAASRVFDRVSGEGTLRDGGWTVSTGVRATNVRGADLADPGAAGPVASAERSGTLGDAGAYDARIDGGVLAGAGAVTTSFAKAGSDMVLATHTGPVRVSWSLRGAGDVAASGATDAYEGSLATRGEVVLPLVRAFDSDDPRDPWRHRLAPRIEVGALAASDGGATAFGVSPVPPAALLGDFPSAGGLSGLAWIADGGFETALGRWAAREGLELRAAVGAVGGDQESAVPVVRWNGAASLPWIGLGAEGAHVFGAGLTGDAMAARVRVGTLSSLHLGVTLAGRGGVDPVLARALTDTTDAASMGFLATEGWTGGARVSLPLTAYLTARGGAEGDLTAEKLVAARASLEFHDRCGCVVVGANGAERIGRPGVDVWLSVSLARR